MLRFSCRVNAATAAMARPARRPAALRLVGIGSLFRLFVPCWTPRGAHPDDRPTAPSRIMAAPGQGLQLLQDAHGLTGEGDDVLGSGLGDGVALLGNLQVDVRPFRMA